MGHPHSLRLPFPLTLELRTFLRDIDLFFIENNGNLSWRISPDNLIVANLNLFDLCLLNSIRELLDEQPWFKSISFELISFELISFEMISFEMILLQSISFESLSFVTFPYVFDLCLFDSVLVLLDE